MSFIPNTDSDLAQMLAALRLSSTEELFADIPAAIPRAQPDLPPPISEMELLAEIKKLAGGNRPASQLPCFLGAGAYEHFIPAAVPALLSRGEFLTSYTPYQPEASQGSLQATFEFQTTICELTAMEAANASMYDGASALAEAGLMAMRLTHKNRLLVSAWIHPHYLATLNTYLTGLGLKAEIIPGLEGITDSKRLGAALDEEVAAIIIQSPNFLGFIEPMAEFGRLMAEQPGLLIACVNPISLAILTPPGEYGADIAVGDIQPLGLPLSFGGPYGGFFACRNEMIHQMPGRLAGVTHDARGRKGYVLTLRAREQDIRREHATSNICSNQALCALAATIHCALMGPEGLSQAAEANLAHAYYLADSLSKIDGCEVAGGAHFFNEFPLRLAKDAERVSSQLLEAGFIPGLPLGRYYPERAEQMLFCATEMRTKEEMDLLAETLKRILA